MVHSGHLPEHLGNQGSSGCPRLWLRLSVDLYSVVFLTLKRNENLLLAFSYRFFSGSVSERLFFCYEIIKAKSFSSSPSWLNPSTGREGGFVMRSLTLLNVKKRHTSVCSTGRTVMVILIIIHWSHIRHHALTICFKYIISTFMIFLQDND